MGESTALNSKLRWLNRSDGELVYLKPTFRESYANAVQNFGNSIFVSYYGYRGERKEATFCKFDQDVIQLAAGLSIPLNRSHIVVIVAGNSYLQLVYIVAHLLIGQTICLFNPAEGATRVAEKIASLHSEVTVWIEPNREELRSIDSHEMELPASTRSVSNAFVARDFAKEQPMILIFTSGSTGYSKIVQQLESNVLSNVDATIEHFDLVGKLGSQKVILTPLPVFHVNALEFSFFGSLFSGAKLVLLEGPLPSLIGEAARLERANIVSAVPQILRSLVEQYEADQGHVDLPDLDYFVTAAAPLTSKLIHRIHEKFGRPVIQGYGLSEAVNFTCILPTDLAQAEYLKWMTQFSTPSIGIPVRGNEVVIVDCEGAAIGEGAIGEVCVSGRNVMKDYVGDAKKRVFDQGLLHTGDMGLYQLDQAGRAFYFITGRLKEVVKRYGMTISLREIDDVAARFERTGFDAITVAYDNKFTGEDVGLAMRLPADWSPADQVALARHFELALPAHLRPRVLVQVNRALRTASGKPCRWPFVALFKNFYDSNFGSNLVTLSFNEDDFPA